MCVMVMIVGFGLIVIIGMFVFAMFKIQTNKGKVNILCDLDCSPSFEKYIDCNVYKEINADNLERRNEFWFGFGFYVIIIVIITILAVLLLAEKISSEAALPIMTGLGSFAAGKTIITTKRNTQPVNTHKNN